MIEIKDFLDKQQFKVCKYKRRQFDKRVNKTIVTHTIELSGFRNFSNWIDKIGFHHPKNFEKVKFLLEQCK